MNARCHRAIAIAIAALFVASTVGFRTTLGLGVSRGRLVAAAAALATIPVGTEWSAAGQLAALLLIVVVALAVEARPDELRADT